MEMDAERMKYQLDEKEVERHVWLLTIGDGLDGLEWEVLSIHFTKVGAESAKKRYDMNHRHSNEIEEWLLEL